MAILGYLISVQHGTSLTITGGLAQMVFLGLEVNELSLSHFHLLALFHSLNPVTLC